MLTSTSPSAIAPVASVTRTWIRPPETAAVGVPDRLTDEPDEPSVRPQGEASPLDTDHVYGPMPPVTPNNCEYGTVTSPGGGSRRKPLGGALGGPTSTGEKTIVGRG